MKKVIAIIPDCGRSNGLLGKNIILLHAFLKHTAKTPEAEIKRAQINYYKIIINRKSYEN